MEVRPASVVMDGWPYLGWVLPSGCRAHLAHRTIELPVAAALQTKIENEDGGRTNDETKNKEGAAATTSVSVESTNEDEKKKKAYGQTRGGGGSPPLPERGNDWKHQTF